MQPHCISWSSYIPSAPSTLGGRRSPSYTRHAFATTLSQSFIRPLVALKLTARCLPVPAPRRPSLCNQVQHVSLQALAWLAAGGCGEELIASGAVAAAVASIRTNASSDLVTAAGLGLLEILSEKEEYKAGLARASLRRARQHSAPELSFCRPVATHVWLQVTDAVLLVRYAAQAALVSAGAIELAVVSLSVHGAIAIVQDAGCCVLRNLSAGPANKEAIVTAGALEAVRVQLEAKTGGSAPHGLAFCRVPARPLVAVNRDASGNPPLTTARTLPSPFADITQLVNTLRHHKGSAAVCGAACGAVRNLATLPEYQACWSRLFSTPACALCD